MGARVNFMLVSAGLVAAASTSAAESPFVKERDAAGSPLLSYQLEQRFSDFMQSCVLGQLTQVKTGIRNQKRPVSAIDGDLITALELKSGKDTIRPLLDLSLVRLFGYVYTTAEQDNVSRSMGRFLRLDYSDTKKSLTPGFSATRHEATCGSIIESAIDVNSEYSFPVATLKAALSGEFDRSQTQAIEIVNGRFTNPVWEMWRGGGPDSSNASARKFYVSVLFWDWYSQAKPAAGEKLWLLNYFDGTILSQIKQRRMTARGTAETQGRLNLPLVNANVQLKTETNEQSDFDSSLFRIYMRADRAGQPATREFSELPSLDIVLQAAASSGVSRIGYPEGPVLESGQTKRFNAEVDALPGIFCDGPRWEVRDSLSAASASTVLKLLSAGEEPIAGGNVTCMFRLSYAPGTIKTADDAELTPVLVSKESYGDKQLKLAVNTAYFQRTPKPLLKTISGDASPEIVPVAASSPPRAKLVWHHQIRLDDDGLYADDKRISPETTLECPANTLTAGDADFSLTFIGVQGPTRRTIDLRTEAEYQGVLDPASYEKVSCKVSGHLVFTPARGGAVVRRPVEDVTIYYPKPK